MQLHLEGICVSSVQELQQSLHSSQVFKEWVSNHPQAYLSHLFSTITSALEQKSSWEIGYFNPEKQKIAVFVKTEQAFMMKQEDEVFKTEESIIEELNLPKAVVSFDSAAAACRKELITLFPKENLGDGFVVLQTIDQKTQWNFTLITKALKFANVKISAVTGKVDTHQLVEAVKLSN